MLHQYMIGQKMAWSKLTAAPDRSGTGTEGVER